MSTHTHRHTSAVVAAATVVGLLVSSGLVAVVVAGSLQWTHGLSPLLDNAIPLAVLTAGMVLAGRVSVDVAGPHGPLAVLVATGVVTAIGWALSRSSEAHGDGIEPQQVLLVTAVVLVVTGGSAVMTLRRRRRRLSAASRTASSSTP